MSEILSLSDRGLFADVHRRSVTKGQSCLFLDRDGVVVQEVDYLHRLADVAIVADVPRMVARANQAGIAVVMVTNQSGIGRGYFDWDAFRAVQHEIHRRFAEDGASFDMTLACAYHADGVGAYAQSDHPWRKPKPGMLLKAAQELNLDLSRSLIVGDTVADLQAGEAAGLREGRLVRTGHGAREILEKWDLAVAGWSAKGDFNARIATDAAEAIADWLALSANDTP